MSGKPVGVSMKFAALTNALANLLGGLIPAAVTIFTLPYITRTLGNESYGALTLISAIIGYFAILDINMTAGSVKFVAEHHATGSVRLRNQTITCGLAMYLAIGAAGCVLIFMFADTLVRSVFVIPVALRHTVLPTLRLAAIGFLCGQVQIYLNSIPQAIRRYDRTAAVEAAFGIIVPASTVGVLWLGYGLYEVVLVRVIASLVNIAVLCVVIWRLLPDVAIDWPTSHVWKGLAKFSGFAYLNRLAAVAFAQGDKLILGAMVSMSALTYYAVPFALVNRLFALTYRLGAVMFPLASALGATKDAHRLREIYLYAARYLLFLNCAITTLLATLAYELLFHWVGKSIAGTGALIVVVLSFASLADSLTNVPSLVNDGLGYPRVTGLFAIARAVVGISLTLILVRRVGIRGAAYSQLLTSITMGGVFLWFAHTRTIPVTLTEFMQTVVLPALPVILIAASVAVIRLGANPLSLRTTCGVVGLEAILLAAYGIEVVLRRDDRHALVTRALRAAHAS